MKKLFASFLSLLLVAGPAVADTQYSGGYKGAGSGGTVGSEVDGAGTNRVLYADASGNLATDADLQFNGTTLTANTVDINAGTIDGTKIGSASAADATFSSATVNGQIIQTNVGAPRNAWIQQTSLGQTSGIPFSMYQGSLYTDQTANLIDQIAFLDVNGDFGGGFHVNLTNNADAAWALIMGAHGPRQVGLLMDIDGTTASGIKLYNNGTGTTGTVQLRANQDYATNGGEGSATAQNFTGNVLESYNVGVLNTWIDYKGNVTIGNTDGFFTTSDTHLSVANTVTSLGTSASPFDLIKISNDTQQVVNPSANTNTGGAGVTLYAASGLHQELIGNKNYNGGLALGSGTAPMSAIGAFGGSDYNATGGTLDGATGVLFSSSHGGYGGAATLLIGGTFDGNTTDAAGGGSVSGSVTTIEGGRFTSGASGISATNAISGHFFEPITFDQGTGVGVPTITNKTAAVFEGTFTITTSNISSSTNITNMTIGTSIVRITGSTATALHGIHADAFSKVLILHNVSSATVTLKHQSGTEGTAANRIICYTGADIAIAAGHSAQLYYDTTQSRWIVLFNS